MAYYAFDFYTKYRQSKHGSDYHTITGHKYLKYAFQDAFGDGVPSYLFDAVLITNHTKVGTNEVDGPRLTDYKCLSKMANKYGYPLTFKILVPDADVVYGYLTVRKFNDVAEEVVFHAVPKRV